MSSFGANVIKSRREIKIPVPDNRIFRWLNNQTDIYFPSEINPLNGAVAIPTSKCFSSESTVSNHSFRAVANFRFRGYSKAPKRNDHKRGFMNGPIIIITQTNIPPAATTAAL